jgi:hypothetical protein
MFCSSGLHFPVFKKIQGMQYIFLISSRLICLTYLSCNANHNEEMHIQKMHFCDKKKKEEEEIDIYLAYGCSSCTIKLDRDNIINCKQS